MACHLVVPCPYLNQCWLMLGVPLLKVQPHLPVANELKSSVCLELYHSLWVNQTRHKKAEVNKPMWVSALTRYRCVLLWIVQAKYFELIWRKCSWIHLIDLLDYQQRIMPKPWFMDFLYSLHRQSQTRRGCGAKLMNIQGVSKQSDETTYLEISGFEGVRSLFNVSIAM